MSALDYYTRQQQLDQAASYRGENFFNALNTLLLERKVTAIRLHKATSDKEIEILNIQFDYINEQIRLYVGV